MDIFGIDINHIVDLATHVATSGALRVAETAADDTFDSIIGIAQVIYEGNLGV
ncbi:MAG: hypothetical protein M3R41_08335 [Pseudomonadota bacterium]|nr:hypothetical protein [Pseudomonadota bacterium]